MAGESCSGSRLGRIPGWDKANTTCTRMYVYRVTVFDSGTAVLRTKPTATALSCSLGTAGWNSVGFCSL